MAGRRKIEVSSDSGAPLGEKTSLDGSEYFPISGSQVAKISSVRTYIAPIDSDSTHFLDGTGQFNLVKDAHLSFSNITTNNADSDHHGFLPLLSGDSNTWLDGKGAWTTPPGSASVYDSDILFTDITTNNADSDHHGFLPKLSGDSDTFLSGKGLWETPTGGSGNVATDAIWDAKGDLAAGTGANTAVRLAGGTDGQVLTYDSAETTGIKWATPTGGALVYNVNTTPVGNVGSGEDDLITYSIPANTLDVNAQYIHFIMGGTFAASINNKRIRIKVGSTTLFDTSALAITAAGDWNIEGYIIRTGSATQKCLVEFESNETALLGSADYVDATEDLTTSLTLKATGEATSDNDIIQKFLIVEKGGGTLANHAPADAEFVTTASNGTLSAEVNIPGLAGSADRIGIGGAGVAYEFDSGASPLSWSAAVDIENVDSTVPSCLYVQDNGAAETLGTYSWSPAGAFDIRCKISMGGEVGTSASTIACGLIVGDSAMNNRIYAGFEYTGTSDRFQVSGYTYASSTYTQRGATNTGCGSTVYLRLVRDGSNNCSFYWSSDGLMWTLIATQSFTFTCAKAGIRVGAASLVTNVAIDWIRSDV